MDKLKMHSPDLTRRNVDRIAELFPSVVTETLDENGQPVRTIDFDALRQELSDHIVEGPQERYQLDWPGKRAAAFAANAPIAKTLRPVREESVDFDTTKNLFIEGDNLEALKLLQESYLGKVKLIYVDPPYNTGNDFVYSDDFVESTPEYLARSSQQTDDGSRLVSNSDSNGRFHSAWLSMMYPRLKLARNLLADDGVLVVSIDENEHANLVRLGQEILGDSSYVGEIVLKNSSKNDQAFISMQHEYIVFFVKNRQSTPGNWVEKKEGLDKIYSAFAGFKKKHGDDWDAIHAEAKEWFKQFPAADPVSSSNHYNWMDDRGVYFASDISGPNDGQYVFDVPHPATGHPVKMPATGWRFPKAELVLRISENRVHFGKDHTTVPKNKTYLANTENQSLTSLRYVDGRAASKRLTKLFGEKVFTNPKDEFLLRDIYRAVGVKGEDVVLDLFAGSGSASQAVIELNRGEDPQACRFIAIQIPEDLNETLKSAKGGAKKVTSNAISMLTDLGRPATVAEIAKQRLRLVSETYSSDDGLDVGFRVLKVDTSNLFDVQAAPGDHSQQTLLATIETVKPDRSCMDLLFQVMMDWAIDLSTDISAMVVEGQQVLSAADDALVACFEDSVTEPTIRHIAQRLPLRAVFLDSGFADDAARINCEQIFSEVSPETDVRTI